MVAPRAASSINSANSTPIPVPTGAQPGDLLLFWAARSGSTTPPSLPAGVTNLANGGANSTGLRCGYRIMQAGDTSWIWTNSNAGVVCLAFSGVAASPIGAVSAVSTGTGATVTIPALPLTVTDGTSWVAAGYVNRDASALATPGSMTERVEQPGSVASTDSAASDTNGGVASWSSTTATATLAGVNTPAGWCSVSVEVLTGLTRITATRSTTWAVRARVAANRATTWAVRKRIAATRATTWAVRQRISLSRVTGWGVRTRITAGRSTTWAVRRRVTVTRATTWALRQRVSATRATSWAVRQRVTRSVVTGWGDRARVSTQRVTTWAVRARVTVSRATTWAVAVTTGTVRGPFTARTDPPAITSTTDPPAITARANQPALTVEAR